MDGWSGTASLLLWNVLAEAYGRLGFDAIADEAFKDLVNGSDHVFIDRGAGLELTDVRFPCGRDVRRLAQHLAVSVDRRLDES